MAGWRRLAAEQRGAVHEELAMHLCIGDGLASAHGTSRAAAPS
jgi:hypothetical protein